MNYLHNYHKVIKTGNYQRARRFRQDKASLLRVSRPGYVASGFRVSIRIAPNWSTLPHQ